MKRELGPRNRARIRAVDLFCGVGGLTHGLAKAGIDVVAGVDVDEYCRFPFEANNRSKFVNADVGALHPKEIKQLLKGAQFTLIAGCAPCQPFSTYSRSGRQRRSDTDWELVASFGRLVAKVRPDFVTMENVPQIEQHPVFQAFLGELKGYQVTWTTVECSTIGVPQTRKRLVLLASRVGKNKLTLATSSRPIATVRQAISHLPMLEAGSSDPSDPLHIACRLSDLNLKRIRSSRPGGTWRDWPAHLRAACHRRETGDTYPSVYGRMEWDAPAPTITTQCFGYGNGRFGHPKQDRAITLREAAILQTFPQDYRFVPKGARVNFSRLGKLIGNAVPVRLGEIIATTLLAHAQVHAKS